MATRRWRPAAVSFLLRTGFEQREPMHEGRDVVPVQGADRRPALRGIRAGDDRRGDGGMVGIQRGDGHE